MENPKNNDGKNHHASVVEIAGLGILILGESGAGKSSLAFSMIEYFSNRDIDAILVADDQVILNNDGSERLIATAPDAIGGKIELYGFGIVEMTYKEETNINLVVDLIEQDKVVRMPEPMTQTISDVKLPCLWLPKQHEQQSVRIIGAWLKRHSHI